MSSASMGLVLVASMLQGGMEEPASKKLHPFFAKGNSNSSIHALPSREATQPLQDDESSNSGPESAGEGRKKRRKTDTSLPDDEPVTKKTRKKRRQGASLGEAIMSHFAPVARAPSSTGETTPKSDRDAPMPSSIDASTRPPEPIADAVVISRDFGADTPPESQEKSGKAKKVLQFNPKTGTLGSPPKPKKNPAPSRIVSIKYGNTSASRKVMGDKITRILDGTWQIPETPKKSPRQKMSRQAKPPEAKAQQATHPFFATKGASVASSGEGNADQPRRSPARRQVVSTCTPVSPRRPRGPFLAIKAPQFNIKSTGTKIPGAMHPLWPPQEMMHIRGDDVPLPKFHDNAPDRQSIRKAKGQVVTVSRLESVIGRLTNELKLDLARGTLPRDENQFDPAPEELRLPQRIFESGRKLQNKIKRQLRTYISAADTIDAESSLDELSQSQTGNVHPAIRRLYDSLETALSAYDRSECESLAWVQKYAPNNASQILQAGKEGPLLKDWLQTLKVQSVGTGASAFEGAKAKTKPEGAAKKKRKKNKLDGFIVDSEEEVNEMDEVSEDEDGWSASGPAGLKRTVIRSGDAASKNSKEQGRLTNAIVISGPHGCGKSAAVYAVAKELDFEVFEINSSTRRSGKDLLERVGDMTRNHLVQQHRAEQAPTDGETEDQVAKDLMSGKQGMMTAFFKPNTAPKTKQRNRPPPKEKTVDIPKAAAKTQRQSVILLEEVDVLYDEDKQFWASLMGMIIQSKRPFIMTCNDESLVPLQSLNLHGIFRFAPPLVDTAVDLCLLIAANEGHALSRPAVDALYASRGYDLRATITELNYWCQIGIGDRRGGFDWFYLRWPKGSDLDGNGDVVRVISENTYLKGMGWVSRDLLATTSDKLEVEQEALRQAWDSWRHDIGDWEDTVDMETCVKAMSKPTSTRDGDLATLSSYEAFCGSMSDADICSNGTHATTLHEMLDATLPELAGKIKDDFIIGRSLLEADGLVRYAALDTDLSMGLKSLARDALHACCKNSSADELAEVLEPVTEDDAIAILDSSFRSPPWHMTRRDLALAFDPIAVSDKSTSTQLDMSVFDRTQRLIVEDVAPWVRGIVTSDNQLMRERLKLSNLLSEGGKRKRMRNTRSAFSALEGGERRTTRREKYFGDALATGFVMNTAGETWQDTVSAAMGMVEGPSLARSPSSEDLLHI